jgi:uncharacterized low-complexity protein
MKKTKKSLNIALGTTLLSGLAVTAVQADVTHFPEGNTFEMTELSNGYMQLAKADTTDDAATKKKEGSCGEGKCGSDKSKTEEGKCGSDKKGDAKAKEGKCGSDKKGDAKTEEGKCGGNKKEEIKTETAPKS